MTCLWLFSCVFSWSGLISQYLKFEGLFLASAVISQKRKKMSFKIFSSPSPSGMTRDDRGGLASQSELSARFVQLGRHREEPPCCKLSIANTCSAHAPNPSPCSQYTGEQTEAREGKELARMAQQRDPKSSFLLQLCRVSTRWGKPDLRQWGAPFCLRIPKSPIRTLFFQHSAVVSSCLCSGCMGVPTPAPSPPSSLPSRHPSPPLPSISLLFLFPPPGTAAQ